MQMLLLVQGSIDVQVQNKTFTFEKLFPILWTIMKMLCWCITLYINVTIITITKSFSEALWLLTGSFYPQIDELFSWLFFISQLSPNIELLLFTFVVCFMCLNFFVLANYLVRHNMVVIIFFQPFTGCYSVWCYKPWPHWCGIRLYWRIRNNQAIFIWIGDSSTKKAWAVFSWKASWSTKRGIAIWTTWYWEDYACKSYCERVWSCFH